MSQTMNMQPEGAVPGPATVATPVIIIDDDPKLCELIRDYLAPLGYDVASANTGPEGLEKVLNGDYRAVILDVMLPGMDGFEVLKAIRHQSNVPVLMLTGRGDEADRVVGLEIGADDYLPKTFSTRELLARLRAVMRRAPSKAGANAIDKSEAEVEADLTNGNLVISPGSRTAALGDVPLKLTSLEFDLLLSLTRARGRVKSREQILDDVAGRDYDVFDRSIDVHVSALRQKLGDDPKAPTFIQTVRSVGYMMIKQ
jgi:two-component system response regulator CpxR